METATLTPTARLPLSASESEFWKPVVLAALVLMVTMGIRQTVVLFVHPLWRSPPAFGA